ncbi:MAG: hypothetical protein IJ597_07890 [Synergistaceae bacterium]|nr:hypothetical protein [Synergistaceae bacterium]
MLKNTRNFNVKEFACHHCGENEIEQKVINLAQKIRDFVGIPIKINSGYRCPIHNKKIGGVPNSYHVQGLAADLSCSIGAENLFIAIRSLYDLGEIPELSFCYLYKKKNFVHIDCGRYRMNGVFQEHD